MKKFYFLPFFLMFIFSTVSLAQDRGKAIVSVIDEELKEIVRLSKVKGNSDPELLLRLAELNVEKARILRESENDAYLALDPTQRTKKKRDELFQESQKAFKQAEVIGVALVKKFPKFRAISEVYLILALNAKEYGNIKQAKGFLKKSVSLKGDAKVRTRAELTLAEIEFNEGKFKEAAALYQRSLPKIKTEKWWTKDAYNLAWCLFRTKKIDQAIELMKEVHSKSSSEEYIDMRSRAEKDIAQFYAGSGRPDEGISFYESLGKDMTKELVSLAKFQADKGQKSNASRTLIAAKKTAKEREDIIEINLTMLNLYDQFVDYDNHHRVALELSKLRDEGGFSKEQDEVYLYQIKKAAAYMQRAVVGKNLNSKEKNKRADIAATYFDLISKVDKSAGTESNYLRGETFYAAGKLDKAAMAYYEALEKAEAENDQKKVQESIDSLLAVLGNKNLNEKIVSRYLLPTYVKYLKYNPKGDKSLPIYQKAFGLYMDKGDLENAEKLFSSFVDKYPSQQKISEAMVANIMEYHRKKNDYGAIKSWVDRIKSGEIKVSEKYALTLNQLITNYQFKKVEKAAQKGDKKGALQEYYRLYANPETSSDVKKNAAYNIAVLFYEIGEIQKQNEWMGKAIELMDSAEITKFSQTFLLMATELFYRQRIKDSAHHGFNILKKVCAEKDKNKNLFFKNSVYMYLAEGDLDKTQDLLNTAERCQVHPDDLRDAKLEYLRSLAQEKRWSGYDSLLRELARNQSMAPFLIGPANELYNTYREFNQDEEASTVKKLIKDLYQTSVRSKFKLPLEASDVIAELEIPRLEHLVKQLYDIELSFPENLYNQRLKDKLGKLDEITNLSLELIKIGSGLGATRAYMLLIESYQRTVKDIRSFVPSEKSSEYIASFQKGMNDLTNPLLKKSLEYLSQARKDIETNKVFSPHNTWFLTNERIPVKTEYFNTNPGVLMGRGGRR